MPAPGDAPCAAARTTAPTDDSTDASHAADGGVPDGKLKDTDTVSTTVVGGIDDTEGLREGVTDDVALADTLLLPVRLTDALSEKDSDGDTVAEPVHDGVALPDALDVTEELTDPLADVELVEDADALKLTLDVALLDADTLADGELE